MLATAAFNEWAKREGRQALCHVGMHQQLPFFLGCRLSPILAFQKVLLWHCIGYSPNSNEYILHVKIRADRENASEGEKQRRIEKEKEGEKEKIGQREREING